MTTKAATTMTRPVAPGTRVLAAGLAISATITMVGAMAAGMSDDTATVSNAVPLPPPALPAASLSTGSTADTSTALNAPLPVVVVGVPGPAPQVVAAPPAQTPVRPRPETTTNASR